MRGGNNEGGKQKMEGRRGRRRERSWDFRRRGKIGIEYAMHTFGVWIVICPH